ncbi:hypothetical protein [Empedobacter sp.]|uniref:hypothetical protein n=1 Tax=Empedobacter sp. TaxID=1927715 RepID=UPI00289BD9FC|nr:hypothetical protein [Empedobacter sp.]
MKDIQIGSLIKKVDELVIDISRIKGFFKTYSEKEINAQYLSKSIQTDDLLNGRSC